jgi:hypothetical protein
LIESGSDNLAPYFLIHLRVFLATPEPPQ